MTTRRVTRNALAYCAAALLYTTGVILAADDVVNFAGKDPSEEEIIKALRPVVKTRGLSPSVAGAAGSTEATVKPQKVSFDQITFEFNSDRIVPKAKTILDRLGRALSSDELNDARFMIEGHTDATGSLAYNMRLSERRAEAVKRYLQERHHIAPERLEPEGKGPTDLLDKAHPDSGVNRRVVFIPAEPK